jgi:hypothetical protein
MVETHFLVHGKLWIVLMYALFIGSIYIYIYIYEVVNIEGTTEEANVLTLGCTNFTK